MISELKDSRKITIRTDGADTTYRYILTEVEDEQAAYALVSITAPEAVTFEPVGVMQVKSVDVDPLGNNSFYAAVQYSTAKPDENVTAGTSPEQTVEGGQPKEGEGNTAPGTDPARVLSKNWSFSTGGGTQHITHSIETVARYAPAGKIATNHMGAINVTSRGIDGVDIHTPEPRLRLKQSVPNMTIGRMVKLCWASCKMNASAWSGFFSRELLFMGAEAPESDERGNRDVGYEFAYSPTYVALDVGGVTVPLKQGWDYLWVEYVNVEDEANNDFTMGVKAVHIEQVYEEIDFVSELGITDV